MHADRHHSVHRRHHRGGGQQGQVVDGRPEFPVLVRRVVRPDRSLVRDPRRLHATTTSGRSRGRRLRHAISSSCTTSGHVFSGFTALGHDLLAVPFPEKYDETDERKHEVGSFVVVPVYRPITGSMR